MIVALVGRRVDPDGKGPARFPRANTGLVRDRIRGLLREVGATALVGSGACGADLLAMDVAGELGLRRVLILPFDREDFRESSVVDRPGDWGPLFDRVTAEVGQAGGLIDLGREGEPDAAYEAVNLAILDEARRLSGSSPGIGVLPVVVWDGRTRGPGDLTASFAREARARGLHPEQISTLADGPGRGPVDEGTPGDDPEPQPTGAQS